MFAETMEGKMLKSLVTIAAALAIVSLGSLAGPAQAGSSTSAPSKYNNAIDGTRVGQTATHHRAQVADYRITEFSSSSARGTGPKR
jgi:hypothetical protein